MQPPQRSDGFTPRYRNFHPQATVWVQNPFNHDVIYQVADEMNRPFKYKLPANQISELPGGAVATLGVKAIVDEMIQNDKDDALSIWDLNVRAKYEDKVILRVKEAPLKTDAKLPTGEIDLSVKGEVAAEKEPEAEAPAETAFPGLEGFPDLENSPNPPTPHEAIAREHVQTTAQSSVSSLPEAQVVEE